MSDDLISRKAVMDYLREQNNNVIIEKHKDGFVSEDACRGMESAISAFRNFILTLPTAFDKEKVIKDLGRCRIYQFQGMLPDGRVCHFSDVIEIVKKGGIE